MDRPAQGPQIARIKPENVDNVVIEDFVDDRKNVPTVAKQSDWKRFVAGVNWNSWCIGLQIHDLRDNNG